jgi:hydrogenase-4 component B
MIVTVVPLPFVAVCGMFVSILIGRATERLWLAATLVSASATLVAAISVLAGGADWEWRGGFLVGGEPLHLRIDGISALFLVLLCVVGGAATVFGREYWSEAAHPRSARAGRVWWSGLLLSMGLVLTVSNGLHFLIAWELFAVCSYFLITLDRQQREVRAAGWLYLVASHVGTLALFAFFATLAARTGSWEIGPMREHAELAPLFWLALFGFGLKAGLFPLHIWLPSAHANAPSHVSAMMSGVTIKLGIYGLVRFSGWLPMPGGAGWVVAALGVASAVLGVAFALGQHDLKRLLAYHSVENIGIILIGLGFALVAVEQGDTAWGRLALAGGLLHVWNHGLFKALLFFGAGSVLHTTGTREMSQMGGLWRAMPWTAGLFALGAAAISGLPPLNGFVSEWLVFLGLFDATISREPSAWAAIPAAILLGVTGALALACFIKVCGVVFLGAARSKQAAHAHECGPSMRGAMVVLAGACVAIGLAPVIFWPAVARAVGTWRPVWIAAETPAPLFSLGLAHMALAVVAAIAAWWLWRRVRQNGLTRALTWDCGYAAPTVRMQYTAGSFAGIITEWFSWILRPERHEHRPEVLFPASASSTEHTPETVLEQIVEPAGGMILRISLMARRLQHGRVQAYILYVLVGVAALAALILWGGVP